VVESPIVAEDERLLWLEKPSGVPVFPPHAEPGGDCLLRRLLQVRPQQDLAFPEGFAGGIAHRLDVPTSGLVVAAKTPEVLGEVRAAFAEGRLRKTYLFLSDRSVPWTEHRVTTRLAHHKRDRRRMVTERGRSTPHRGRWYDADTRLRHLRGPLWEAVIVTGVMHQIRAHAASVGLALRGDRLYGGRGEGPFRLHHSRLEGLGPGPTSEPDWLLELAP